MRTETALWQDVAELPEALAATIDSREGVDEVAALLGSGAAWAAALEAALLLKEVPGIPAEGVQTREARRRR